MVLDIASGWGALARRLPDVVALDISWSILASNDGRAGVQADAEHLPFAGDSFGASVGRCPQSAFTHRLCGQRPAVRVYPPQLDGHNRIAGSYGPPHPGEIDAVLPGRVRNNTSDPTGLKPAASTARSEAALPGDTWA